MVMWPYPKTVDECVERLIEHLPLKYRHYLAGLEKEELHLVHIALSSHIRQEFGLASGNKDLVASCRKKSGIDGLTGDQVPDVIILALWDKLRETHVLRIAEKPSKNK